MWNNWQGPPLPSDQPPPPPPPEQGYNPWSIDASAQSYGWNTNTPSYPPYGVNVNYPPTPYFPPTYSPQPPYHPYQAIQNVTPRQPYRPYPSSTSYPRPQKTPATTRSKTRGNDHHNFSALSGGPPMKVWNPYQPPNNFRKPRTLPEWRSYTAKTKPPLANNKLAALIAPPKPVPVPKPTLPKPLPPKKIGQKEAQTLNKQSQLFPTSAAAPSEWIDKKSQQKSAGGNCKVGCTPFSKALDAVGKRMSAPLLPSPVQRSILIQDLVDAVIGDGEEEVCVDSVVSLCLDRIGKALKSSRAQWRLYLWSYIAILHRLKVPGNDPRFSVVRSLFDHILNSGYVKLTDDVGELEVIRNYWGLHLKDMPRSKDAAVVDCTISSVETKLRSRYSIITSKIKESADGPPPPPSWEVFVRKLLQTLHFEKIYPPPIHSVYYSKKKPLFKSKPSIPDSLPVVTPSSSPPSSTTTKSGETAPSKTASKQKKGTAELSDLSTAKKMTELILNSENTTATTKPLEKSKKVTSIINPAQIMTRLEDGEEKEKSKEANGEKNESLTILEVVQVPQGQDYDNLIISFPTDSPLRLGLPVENDDSCWRPSRRMLPASASSHPPPIVPIIAGSSSQPANISSSIPGSMQISKSGQEVPVAVVVGSRNTSQGTNSSMPPPPARKMTTADTAREKIRQSQKSQQLPSCSTTSTTTTTAAPTNKLVHRSTQRFQPLSYFVYPEDANVKKGPKRLQQQQRLRAMGMNGDIPPHLRLLPDPPPGIIDADSDASSSSSSSEKETEGGTGSSEGGWDICPERHDELLLAMNYTDEEYVDFLLNPKFYAQAIKDVGGLWQIVFYHQKEENSTNI